MRCERCQGIGFIESETWPQNGRGGGCLMYPKQPCPDCQGTGISYCCDEAGANPPNTFDFDKMRADVMKRFSKTLKRLGE